MKKNSTLCLKTLLPTWINWSKGFVLSSAFLFSTFYTHAQCAAGWNTANTNWDNLDYLVTTGNYAGFVTPAMAQTQAFAIGKNRFVINFAGGITCTGENTTHTGDAGSFGAGADVAYSNNGTITLTFDTVVTNLQFSIYDIDNLQSATVTALDALGLPLLITMTAASGTPIITIVGSGTTSANASDLPLSSAAGNASNIGTANISISGGLNGVKSVTINMGGTAGDFWLSDMTACVYGSFPTNYFAVDKPFTGQPAYTLATSDTNSVSVINPTTGTARMLFRDVASPRYVNGLAYDPYNKNVYYVIDFTTSPSTNKTLKKFDYNTETIDTVISDVNTLGIPTFTRGVESAGSSFYDGSLYFGVEGNRPGNSGGRETIVWRIDFNASGTPIKSCQVYATPSDNGSGTLQHDWGDFAIYDGILYDFCSAGTNPRYTHYDLQTQTILNIYPSGAGNPVPKQVGLRWDGTMYWLNDSIATYNGNGTLSPRTRITGVTVLDWTGFAGDGTGSYRPKTDFGDAPASYDPSGGDPATHEYDSTILLGTSFDREFSKFNSANATGDGTDEDAFPYLPIFTHSQNYYDADINVLNKSGAAATVVAWIDIDNDGLFEASEGITVNVNSNPSVQSVHLQWTGQPTIAAGVTNVFVRIRITSQSNGMTVNNPNGFYNVGEVEDYLLSVDDLLPVNLLAFDAKAINNNLVNLDWKVSSEVNVISHIIEKSKDGNSWETVSVRTVNNGTTGTAKYASKDREPYAGTSYYRLKIVDRQNKVIYSSLKRIDIQAQLVSRISPNPFTSSIKVEFALTEASSVEIQLLDYSGKIINRQHANCLQGINWVQLDNLGMLPKGLYIVSIINKNNTEVKREKVLKQ